MLFKVPMYVTVRRPAEYVVDAQDIWHAVELAESGDTVTEDFTGLGEVIERDIDGDPEETADIEEPVYVYGTAL